MSGKRTVLITGASSGIGRELARVFAAHDHDLILVARDRSRLETLAEELRVKHTLDARVEVCDLSRAEDLETFISRLTAESQKIDVLVNNAGFGIEGPFSETSWEDERAMLEVNLLALTRLTKAFLPQMLNRGSGKILQVASTAAFQPGPFLSVYFASKAFVLSFSEAISVELRGSGVSVTALCPGPTRTGFEKKLGPDSKLFETGLPVARAEDVALYAYRALMANRRVAIPGLFNRILALVSHWIPNRIKLPVMAKMTMRSRRI